MKDNYGNKNAKIGLVRSFVIILLSFIVFVTAVVAWFVVNDKVTATGISVTIKAPDTMRITDENGNDISSEQEIVLPCATKIDEVTEDNLEYALLVKKYRVYYSDKTTDIKVSVSGGDASLHYYFDTTCDGTEDYSSWLSNDNGDTKTYRDKINNDGADSKLIKVNSTEQYHTFAVVLYSDYDSNNKEKTYSTLTFNLGY